MAFMVKSLVRGLRNKVRNFFVIRRLDKIRTVVICAGGTGGHIFPAFKVSQELLKANKKVFFLTDKRFDNYLSLLSKSASFKDPSFHVKYINIISPSRSKAKFILQAPFVFLKSLWFLMRISPHKVLAFGGYVSFFPLIASIVLRKTIILHEQNAILGSVNRWFMPFCSYLFTTFPKTLSVKSKYAYKTVCTGIPSLYSYVEPKLSSLVPLDLTIKSSIVITGGSQAASSLDKVISTSITRLTSIFPEIKFSVYHQVNSSNIKTVKQLYSKCKNIEAEVSNFFVNIDKLLSGATFAIIRAGALSIAEVAMYATPSIIIPIKHSKNNHQYENAKYMLKNNASIMLEEDKISEEKLITLMSNLLNCKSLYSSLVTSVVSIFPTSPVRNVMNMMLLSDMEYIGISREVQRRALLPE